MNATEHSAESKPLTEASLPTGDALPGAYAMLKSQFEQQQDTLGEQHKVITAKDAVISAKDARIAVLEELLELNKSERFAASSESNPLQANFFNEPEMWAGTEPEEAEEDKASQDNEAREKAKQKSTRRKGLNPNIPRTQERFLLTDEERENAIDTFFVSVKEELDITPARVQVIEYLQEKAVYLDDAGERKLKAASRPAHPLGKCIASVALL